MDATEHLRGVLDAELPSLRLSVRRQHIGATLGFCLFGVAYYFAFRYGMSFAFECASPFWFPDSVFLCALLLSPPRWWWIFVLIPLPIRLFSEVGHGIPSWFLLTTYAIDTARGLLTASVLRRLLANPLRFETLQDFALYCLLAVLLIPAASAFLGAAARYVHGYEYWPAWQQWFMGDALTHLVVTPAILYWLFSGSWRLRPPFRGRTLEGGLLAIGLVLTGYMASRTEPGAFGFAEPRFYAPVPFLFWAAFRFGMLGATGAVAVLALLCVNAALAHHGPFYAQSPEATAFALQHFLSLRAVPIYVVALLVEQNVHTEQFLRESEARFRNMADTAPVMIWVSGRDKGCIYFNQRWLDFTGRPLEAELGDGWIANVHPADLDSRVVRYREAFDSRKPFVAEYRLRRADGHYRWMLAHAVPRAAPQGGCLGYIGTCIDITDRKGAEAEAQRQRVELAHAARVSTMGQLASALAHELSQPLGAILRNAEAGELILQQHPPDNVEVRAILSDIRQDDQRASAVIDRMRSFLKRRSFEFEPLSITQLLDQVMLLVRAEMSARRVAIEVSGPNGVPPVYGDRIHLQQVVLNLLMNGADAMEGLPVEQRRLDIRAARLDDLTVEVSVHDRGHGIPEGKFTELFEPFFTTKSNGMGMGLAISKTIVEAHGGRIRAANNDEGGATVGFTLRIANSRGMA
jgi:PAS domain S-box-containing protein